MVTDRWTLALESGALGDLDGGPDIGAGGDPGGKPLVLGERLGGGEGVLVADLDHLVDDVELRFFGMNPAPIPWIMCGPGLSSTPPGLGDHRAGRRLDGESPAARGGI
jgi:hypothetical protein